MIRIVIVIFYGCLTKQPISSKYRISPTRSDLQFRTINSFLCCIFVSSKQLKRKQKLKFKKMKTETKKRNVFRRVKRLTFSAVIMITILFATKASAQSHEKKDSERWISPARTAVNVCPGGIFFGFYSVNVEHLFGKNHGLVLRGDLETIPKTYSDANINANGKAVVLNYRYHIGGGLNSFYGGAYARYRKVTGDGSLESGNFDFKMPAYTVGLNAGKRWIWKSGLTLNFTLGYGFTHDKINVNNLSREALNAIDVFRDEYDFNSSFMGELSIGYAF